MSDNFRFKRKRTTDSVDGIISRPLPKSTTHQYYSNRPQRVAENTKRHPVFQASRKRPHLDSTTFEEKPEKKEAPKLGDFDSKDNQEFNEFFANNSEDKKIEDKSKDKVKDKKEKKRGRIRSWWKNRSLKFKFGLVSFILLLGAGGLLGIRLYSFLNSVFAKGVGNSSSAALGDKVKPEQLNTEGDGRLNVLLMGRGGTENEAPDLTDTLLIASIDLENQSTSLLSIPRDTWVTVNGSGMKINATYSTIKQNAIAKGTNKDDAEVEGIKKTIEVVRNVAGVPIHKYVLTDYKAFRDVVNALGGVDITLDKAIYDSFTGWSFKAGPQTMNGDTALKLARSRHGSARGDFDRNENQRKLLIAMRKKATSTGIVANPVKLNSLANAVQKNIKTDLSIDEAKTVFDKTKEMQDSSIVSLDLAKPDEPLVTTGNINGQSIVRPTLGISDYTKIRAYVRSNMVDPYLKKEAPTIAIYNASGKSGIATQVGDIMAGYGYKILIKETATSTQNKTLVVKKTQTDKPFTNRFLSIRFSTVIGNTVPDNIIPAKETSSQDTNQETTSTEDPDYIIVLGTDFKITNGPTW